MKRAYITTILVCLALLVFAARYIDWNGAPTPEVLKVGFVYTNDEMMPSTYNFALTQDELVKVYGERVEVLTRNNVPEKETEQPLRDLANKGCGIIFVYSHSNQVTVVAREYPVVQFCQISRSGASEDNAPENYHTFNAAVYEGRYVGGIAAGMKLRAMLDAGQIQPDGALVGFVGVDDSPEVLSAAAAFLLGVRSVAPEATMRLRLTGAWTGYNREKACTEALIDEGCIVIAQQTSTIGPAVACEEAARTRPLYHVGQDQSMVDLAPTSSLVSFRVNWSPYVLGAVDAVMHRHDIERQVRGRVIGNDVFAGFDRDWIQMLEMNMQNVVDGTQKAMDKAVEALRRGKLEVFKGDYTGVDPHNPLETFRLSQGFHENSMGSAPEFHYLLYGVMQLEE